MPCKILFCFGITLSILVHSSLTEHLKTSGLKWLPFYYYNSVLFWEIVLLLGGSTTPLKLAHAVFIHGLAGWKVHEGFFCGWPLTLTGQAVKHRIINTCWLGPLLGQFTTGSDLYLDQGQTNLSQWNMGPPWSFLWVDMSLGPQGSQELKEWALPGATSQLPGGWWRPVLLMSGSCLTHYFSSH